MRTVFGEEPRPRPEAAPPAEARRAPPSTDAIATAVWAACLAPESTPARAYLASRRTWPPDGADPALRPSVRWCRAADFPARARLPRQAAGTIVYQYRPPSGGFGAVDCEALAADGRRVRPRWRRTFGPKHGALFEAATGVAGGDLALFEGPASALAGAWLYPGARCLATGGMAGLAAVALNKLAPDGRAAIMLDADGDRAGDGAADAARERLAAAGAAVRVVWRSADDDAAAELASTVGERAAVFQLEGGLSAPDALAAAWQAMRETQLCEP